MSYLSQSMIPAAAHAARWSCIAPGGFRIACRWAVLFRVDRAGAPFGARPRATSSASSVATSVGRASDSLCFQLNIRMRAPRKRRRPSTSALCGDGSAQASALIRLDDDLLDIGGRWTRRLSRTAARQARGRRIRRRLARRRPRALRRRVSFRHRLGQGLRLRAADASTHPLDAHPHHTERPSNMNMIELHILQSFPVTCLNRDDLGAPKSALFGGVQRARVSSQCWKRAIRELASNDDSAKDFFAGRRTRYVVQALESTSKGPTGGARQGAGRRHGRCGETDTPRGNVKDASFFSPRSSTRCRSVGRWISTRCFFFLCGCVARQKKPRRRSRTAKPFARRQGAGDRRQRRGDIAIRRLVARPHLDVEGRGLARAVPMRRNELDFFSRRD